MSGYYNTVWTCMECNLLIYKDKNEICGLYNTLQNYLWRSPPPPNKKPAHVAGFFIWRFESV
jgi:hypothetical protein